MAGKRWKQEEKEILLDYCVHDGVINDSLKISVKNKDTEFLNATFGVDHSKYGWNTAIRKFLNQNKSFVEKSLKELNGIIDATYPAQGTKCKHCGVKFKDQYIHFINDVPICERCLCDGIKKQNELFQQNEGLEIRVRDLQNDNAYLLEDRSIYITQVDELKTKVSFLEKLLKYTEDQMDAYKEIQEALEQTVSLFLAERKGY